MTSDYLTLLEEISKIENGIHDYLWLAWGDFPNQLQFVCLALGLIEKGENSYYGTEQGWRLFELVQEFAEFFDIL